MTKLQLEEGKYYFDRGGRRYGPLLIATGKYMFECPQAEAAWRGDGRFMVQRESGLDLVAEAPAPLAPSTDGLPVYRCHKEVWAGRIVDVDGPAGGRMFGLEVGKEVLRVPMSDELWARLPGAARDCIGWWYVRYADGYESVSPAKAFEEGYALVGSGA